MNTATQTDNTVITVQTSQQWQCVLAFGIEANCNQAVSVMSVNKSTSFEVMP